MALGLLLSAALAYATAVTPALQAIFFTSPMIWIILFAPLALILISNFFLRNPSPTSANLIYWGVVATMGISLGLTVMIYAASPGGMFTIVKALLVTCATFGALSLWGYTTKRDLSGFGTFLYMGVIGILIAMVVNFFLHSSALDFAITVIGVLIFSGLTAFKTQQIKWSYYQLGGDARAVAVGTTYAALSLYITFINLFLFVLRLMGGRR
jgi:FtsH-binding integral membrane protein